MILDQVVMNWLFLDQTVLENIVLEQIVLDKMGLEKSCWLNILDQMVVHKMAYAIFIFGLFGAAPLAQKILHC